MALFFGIFGAKKVVLGPLGQRISEAKLRIQSFLHKIFNNIFYSPKK